MAMDKEIARRAATNSMYAEKVGGKSLSGIPIVVSTSSCTAEDNGRNLTRLTEVSAGQVVPLYKEIASDKVLCSAYITSN